MNLKLGPEPTLILYGILAALNAVQVAVLNIPDWVHAIIIALSAGIVAVLNRAQVTPVAKPVPPPAPVAPVPPAT
jgi:hypothetical protein